MQKQIYHVICPRCGEEFDEREKFCPYCQTPNRKIVFNKKCSNFNGFSCS